MNAVGTDSRPLLAAGAVGAVLFVTVFLIDGVSRAGYSPLRHPVSALALGDRGWVQIANFVATGLAMGAFALGLRRVLGDGPAAVWGPLLLGAFALGLVASGVFVMDPAAGYPPGTGGDAGGGRSSWHNVAHDIAGLVVFTALPAGALVVAGRFRHIPGLEWLGPVSVAAGLLTAALFVTFAVAYDAGSGSAGLVQRAAIVVGWGWVALVAVALLATGPERTAG